VAKAAAGAAATLAAKDGIQVHGGIGYTWEHDLHLFIRRAYASEHLLGTSGWHHDRLADLLIDGRRRGWGPHRSEEGGDGPPPGSGEAASEAARA
jgi:alkylation response protein AidB-like acyl-CoA dehydrogenase